MAGEAKTDDFMLGTATVMVGPVDEVFDLNPTANSIGLVKNFQLTSSQTFATLTQGVKNTQVYNVHTGTDVRASMEVYEFTARNLSYAAGLGTTGVTAQTAEGALAGAQDGTATPVTSLVLGTGEGANFAVNDYINIVAGGSDDNIIVRRVTAVVADTITVHNNIVVSLPSGAVVRKVNSIRVGNKDSENAFFSAKVVGKLVNQKDVVLLFPKIRITGGFTLQFQTNDYGNLPFEFSPLDLVNTDTHFAEFPNEQARLMVQ